MPVAEVQEKEVKKEERVEKDARDTKEGEEEVPPGTYFAQYKTETEAEGPCIVSLNSKMYAEILDARYQEINTDRTFLIDEELEDGEFICSPLNRDVFAEIPEEPEEDPPVLDEAARDAEKQAKKDESKFRQQTEAEEQEREDREELEEEKRKEIEAEAAKAAAAAEKEEGDDDSKEEKGRKG